MSRVQRGQAEAWADGYSTTEDCRRAVEILDRALGQPAAQLKADVDRAENAVVRLRDHLIDQLRSDPDSVDAAARRATLERVNAILSLIAGVEYPAAGIQRSALEQARDAMKKLLEEGLS